MDYFIKERAWSMHDGKANGQVRPEKGKMGKKSGHTRRPTMKSKISADCRRIL